MKNKAFSWLTLLLGLVAFAAIGTPSGGLGVVLRHIEIAGPRQWLNLVAGSLVSGTPLVAPITERIARAIPSAAGDNTADIA
jgi:hypothetical protein